jgi:hypothetical protein
MLMITMIQSCKINEKFCVNCKYFIPNKHGNDLGKCSMFTYTNTKNLITGENNKNEYHYCSIARNRDYLCGVNATKYKKIPNRRNYNTENLQTNVDSY